MTFYVGSFVVGDGKNFTEMLNGCSNKSESLDGTRS